MICWRCKHDVGSVRIVWQSGPYKIGHCDQRVWLCVLRSMPWARLVICAMAGFAFGWVLAEVMKR